MSGNIFAEYIYIQYAIQKAKTWAQETVGIGEIKQAVEEKNAAAMAIWGIIQYISYRPKGIIEEIFEGPKYNDKAFEAGIAFVQESANLGDPAASSYMGAWCASGNITQVVKNDRDAYKYIQTAAKKNYPTALYRLGTWYLNGSHGVRKAPDIGYELIEKAAFYGDESAADMVKKSNEKWFETDFRALEDQDQIDLSLKLLHPVKRMYTKDIVFDENVDLTYNGITYSSIAEMNDFKYVYLAESKYANYFLTDCASLEDFFNRVWDILKSVQYRIYDVSEYLHFVREKICKFLGISEQSFDEFVEDYSQYAYIQDNEIIFKSIPDHYIDSLLSSLETHKSSVIYSRGTTIPNGRNASNIRVSFRIPENEPIYLVRSASLLDNYSVKAKGFAFTATGVYYRDDTKNIGYMKWIDFAKSKISIDKNINSSYFYIDSHNFWITEGRLAQVDLLTIVNDVKYRT